MQSLQLSEIFQLFALIIPSDFNVAQQLRFLCLQKDIHSFCKQNSLC